MRGLTLRRIADVCCGTWRGPEEIKDREVTAITTDSRTVTSGCLFVAIRGARADGHDFIDQVLADGAVCALGERAPADAATPFIEVASSLDAVKAIAREYRQTLGIPVVGVTGSVGKTSTKEMIAHILAEKLRVLKTEGNFNNELGLPLTIFRLREEDEIAVLEMGISDFGEMHRLADIARPDICVLTNIGQCHLEQLGDRDGVLRAKSEIFDFLGESGAIVLNGDDDKLATVERPERTLRFGMGGQNDVRAENIMPRGLAGCGCTIVTPEGTFDVEIPVPGRHMVMNALAGTAVGLLCGLTCDEIRRGIEHFSTIAGRFHIIEQGGATIIDDCYNANPASMRAALDLLKEAEGRRVAILGDMGELGKEEADLHAELGVYAAGSGIDVLYCAGARSEHTARAAAERGLPVRHFAGRDELLAALSGLVGTGDTILVKASHFMGYDRVVSALAALFGG